MLTKKDLIKVSDYLWEIPKSFRSDMRVPARIYADERLLQKAFEDESLTQLVNTTTLPGIIKYALAMPDIHEGYGFPIGGVAATDVAAGGVISPGGVGFDINCLHPETKILLNHYAWVTAEDFIKHQIDKIPFINFQQKKIHLTPAVYFLKRKENKELYLIRTEFGQNIKVTAEHPLYTDQGMKQAKDLIENEKLVIYPFKGNIFEKSSKKIILTETDIRKLFNKLNRCPAGHAWEQILKKLKQANLIPLTYNNPKIPYILKIMGYILGDGTMSFIGKEKKGSISFYGKAEDLERIRQDVKILGLKPSKIYQRLRQHKFKNAYDNLYTFETNEQSFKVRSTGLVLFLIALGLPFGNKCFQEFRIPAWLKGAPKWQQRLFLAAFFGAEFSTPKTLNNYNFYCPTLNINKSERLLKNGFKFLEDIRSLLKKFNIRTGRPVLVEGGSFKGKRGKTVELRLQILSNPKNLLNFFGYIGFEYNRKKQKRACLAIAYLKFKEKIIKERREIRKKVRSLYLFGQPAAVLCQSYSTEYAPLQFIEHSLWSSGREMPRIASNFPSFEKYCQTQSFGDDGLVWDRIETIEKIPYRGWVYDLTIKESDHNFIANNFVVSNCGVRILKSDLIQGDIQPHLVNLMNQLQRDVPSGVGRGGRVKLDKASMKQVLEKGVPYVVAKGYGQKEDIEYCEEQGAMAGADAEAVSEQAKNRGRDQLGTLGSGNHFLEIQKVEEIFDQEIARIFGLQQGQITVMIHCGSRGLGHQICADYVRLMHKVLPQYGIKLPDPELACAPFKSVEGKKYFSAMAAAANFAWSNRQVITHFVRQAWNRVLGESADELRLIYDVAHNIAKIERHQINGQEVELCMHRKGATRAFPPPSPEIPQKYQAAGQPVLIPGTMGTASYILAGVEQAKESFFSVCHGAGRVMSRHAALKQVQGAALRQQLEQQGIVVRCLSSKGLAEEAPLAYKDVDNVVSVVAKAGLAKIVAKLRPLGVLKG